MRYTRGPFQLFSLSIVLLHFLSAQGAVESSISQDSRLNHARELLGKSFKRTVVRKEDSAVSDVEVTDFVMEMTRNFLGKKHRHFARDVGRAILNASEEFSLDPVFLVAVIQNESSFHPSMKGSAGEIGLMQILPRTGEWIASLYHLDYRGSKSLLDPVMNVWLGAALLDKLRHQFDSDGRYYVTAYNMGPKKLRKMIAMNRNPRLYVQAVMKRYLALYQGYQSKGDLKVVSKEAKSKVMEITN